MGAIQEMQQAGTAIYKVDDMEFGRRLAVERELEKDMGVSGSGEDVVRAAGRTMNAVWDESGNFVIYPTMLGIKGTLVRSTITLVVVWVCFDVFNRADIAF